MMDPASRCPRRQPRATLILSAAVTTLAALLLTACSEPKPGEDPEPADLIVRNARILSVDDDFSIHEAMAVRDGRILAVGDAAVAERYRAPRTLDLDGATVMPGFVDTHVHVQSYARRHVPLAELDSIAAIQQAVRAKAEALGPGEWITGYGWSEDRLAEGRRPLREDLDAAAPENPVLLTRAGGHSAVASSLALDRAGIDRDTPDPDGGVIERGPEGAPNGVIRERQDLVAELVPEPSREALVESLTANLRALLPHGITSFVHASERIERWPIWREIYAARGEELPRATVQVHWEGREAMAAFRERASEAPSRLRPGAIKIFADGGFTGPAAYTKAPYKGEETYRGHLNMPEAELRELIRTVHDAGWQLGIHAIGDAAIELTVDALADALEASPRTDHRHYLNHFSMRPSDATMERMAAHGIAITQQPNFTYTLEGRYTANLDGWRLAHNNPLRAPLEHGVRMALSSDSLPLGPMLGIYAAVTRKGPSGEVYGPDEAIGVERALRGYTAEGAWLTFTEEEKGILAPGKRADFVVLSGDPLAVPPDRLREIEVLETWVDGRRLWRRGEAKASPPGGGTDGAASGAGSEADGESHAERKREATSPAA